jgi:ADP-L-glycero-D-manno-heptose 6-epimerase
MYIVTGGAGFIGSAIVWKLNNENITDIIIVDHLGTSEKWKNLRALKYANYFEKDVFLEKLEEGFFNGKKIDAIIHMGACSSTTEKDASYLIKNNFEYTKTLCTYAIKGDIPFIYASSAATYGNGEHGYSDSHDIEKLRPLNMYGYSKQMFDLWAKNTNVLDKIIGLKFFNIYGPNEYHKGDMRSMVLKAYEQIEKHGKVKLFKSYNEKYEDGKQMRDFCYIKDAINMFFYLLSNFKNVEKGLYNIGTGKAHTWLELITPIFEALNLKTNIEFIEMPEELKEKYQYFTQADITKLKRNGYRNEITDISDAVKDYVLNYIKPKKYLGD